MQRRGYARRATVLPLQVQWQHQVRPPGLPDGMALPFPEEALRAVQDALPLHQAIRPEHAQNRSILRFYQPHRKISVPQYAGLGSGWLGPDGLAGLVALPHEEGLVSPVLAQ